MREIAIAIALSIAAAAAAAPAPAAKPPAGPTLATLVERLKANPTDVELRRQAIAAAQAAKPKPALPEAALRHIARGNVGAKDAKTPADHLAAAAEFEAAALEAPWHAEAYRQAALARSNGDDPAGAAAALKLYLLAAPNAGDADAVRTQMYELEFRAEKAGKEKAEREAEAARIRNANQVLAPLLGSWRGRNCQVGNDHFGGCNDQQQRGNNWYVFEGSDGPFTYQFKFMNDGTVKLDAYESWAECQPGAVWGDARGASSLSGVRWELRDPNGTPIRQVYMEINESGTWMKVSCDRPLYGADPERRYHYVIWTRP